MAQSDGRILAVGWVHADDRHAQPERAAGCPKVGGIEVCGVQAISATRVVSYEASTRMLLSDFAPEYAPLLLVKPLSTVLLPCSPTKTCLSLGFEDAFFNQQTRPSRHSRFYALSRVSEASVRVRRYSKLRNATLLAPTTMQLSAGVAKTLPLPAGKGLAMELELEMELPTGAVVLQTTVMGDGTPGAGVTLQANISAPNVRSLTHAAFAAFAAPATAFFLRAMRPRVFRQATGFRTVIARTVGNVAPTPFRGQFPLLPGEKTLALRALVDRSIAEFVLAHGRSASAVARRQWRVRWLRWLRPPARRALRPRMRRRGRVCATKQATSRWVRRLCP